MFPHLIHIYGPVWIQSYGVMIAFGFLTFLGITYSLERRKKIISDELYINTVYLGLAAGIVGGRLLTVINAPEAFSEHWYEIFFPWIGGFTVLGAILGVIVAASSYLWFHGISIFPVLDIAAVYTPLMQAIARIGCFLAGCCYGMPAAGNTWWAVTFTDPACQAPLHVPLHPAQLYTMIGSFTVFLIIFFLASKLYDRPGALTFLYLALENINRFVTDFWRGDREALHIYNIFNVPVPLSIMQVWSLAIGILSCTGLIIIFIKSTQQTKLNNL